MKNFENYENKDSIARWENRYQDKLTGWERGEVNQALLNWLDQGHLQPGTILIPGCGRSPEPGFLAELGFDVTGLDFAPSAIEHQRAEIKKSPKNLKLRFEQVDVLTWLPEQPVDAVYEQTCLCALQPKHRTAYERQLQRWLRPGGKLFALFMQTPEDDGPPFHCDLEDMKTLFDDSRWYWQDVGHITSEHSDQKQELGRILIRR